MRRVRAIVFPCFLLATAVQAQQEQGGQYNGAGDVSMTSAGKVGERQTRETAVPDAMPMQRIANRIQNRVQNRLRNRIDRDYDPRADAAKSVEAAQEQTRATGTAWRR